MPNHYVVTFGRYHYETKHTFNQKKAAVRKARALKKQLPEISFQVKKV